MRTPRFAPRSGQILPFTAISMMTLLLFVGMGIDYGFVYLVRADLSKSVDAAALAGIRNVRVGRSQAQQVAESTFAANYESSSSAGRNPAEPFFAADVRRDASDNTLVTVDAAVDVRTFFLGILPAMRTMRVTAHAETIRPKMIVSMVLDRSGSMLRNGGAAALPDAVTTFLDYFDDGIDRVSLTSFASAASIDVALARPFKGRVGAALTRLVFNGYTASEQGVVSGFNEARRVRTLPDEEVVKSLVFFTDGLANTFEVPLDCGDRNLSTGLTLYDPRTGDADGDGCTIPASLVSVDASVVATGDPCAMQEEAEKRTEAAARQARRDGIYVYAVALGGRNPGLCGRETVNVPFLQRVANDPASTTYDINEPVGAVAVAETAGQLDRVFGEIAQMVLYRLRQ